MIQYIYQPKRGQSNGKRSRSVENYRGKYKLPGMAKLIDVSLHTTDKRVAEKRLAEIVKERQQEASGIIAPKPLRDAATRPLTEHLAEYVSDLTALGRNAGYIYNTRKLIEKLLDECGWILVKDVTADAFLTWRAKQSKAAKTLNEYLNAISGLLNWMKRQGRCITNPLEHVGKVELRGRRVRERRALSDDEAARLVTVDEVRGLVYQMALMTGIRRGELRSLCWGDLHLDSDNPCVHVRASTTKNRKDASIPLHSELAARLRTFRPADVSSDGLVFGKQVPRMAVLLEDLKAAGIPFVDERGRRADFHALRGTFCTNLARSGVHPVTAMELMRHSDMKLTAKTYMDVSALPIKAAVDQLPGYGSESAKKRSHELVTKRREVSHNGTTDDRQKMPETPIFTGVGHDLSFNDATCHERAKNWGSRIRTLTN